MPGHSESAASEGLSQCQSQSDPTSPTGSRTERGARVPASQLACLERGIRHASTRWNVAEKRSHEPPAPT